MFLFIALSVLTTISTGSEDGINWKDRLNPEISLRLRALERRETGYDLTQMGLKGNAGIFPLVEEKYLFGLELGTFSHRSKEIILSESLESQSVGISQAFVGFRLPTRLQFQTLLGKFQNPILISPLIFSREFRPAGAFQSLKGSFASDSEAQRFTWAIYAGQFLGDHSAGNQIALQSQRRFWIFEHGLNASYYFDNDHQFIFGANHITFYKPTSRIANLSARRGNQFAGVLAADEWTNNSNVYFTEDFQIAELIAGVEGRPLGIDTRLYSAIAYNFGSHDRQRGFWIRGDLGRPSNKDGFSTSATFIYTEPDLTIATFSDEETGYNNRKGTRFDISYYPLSFGRLGIGYGYYQVIARSVLQARRQEWNLDCEVKF